MDLKRWQRFSKWMDCHWRIIALTAGVVIAAILVAVLVHRLNETDAKLKRAICVEISFLAGRPQKDSIPKLVANLRREVDCSPPPVTTP